MPDTLTGLGPRVRQARTDAGLSQTQLAEQMGSTQRLVSDWERCVRIPSARSLVRLAQALDVTTDWLLGL